MSEVESRGKGRTRGLLEIVVGVLAVLSFFGISTYTDLFGTREPSPPATSSTVPSPPTSAVVPPPSADVSAAPSDPTIEVSPQPVPVGSRYAITGQGFRPGQGVTIRSGSFFVGFAQADGQGRIRVSFPPTDQSSCATPTVALDAVGRGEELLAGTTARFCF